MEPCEVKMYAEVAVGDGGFSRPDWQSCSGRWWRIFLVLIGKVTRSLANNKLGTTFTARIFAATTFSANTSIAAMVFSLLQKQIYKTCIASVAPSLHLINPKIIIKYNVVSPSFARSNSAVAAASNSTSIDP